MKRFLVGSALVALALGGFAPDARALGGGACRISGRIVFSPQSDNEGGWSIDRGVIECAGLLAGGKNRILGPGEFTGSGSYKALAAAGGACLHQAGTGKVEWRIPTSGGYLVVSDPVTYTLVGVGAFTSPNLFGTFQAAPPYSGDCVTKPMTSAAFVAEALLYRGVEPKV